MNVWQNGNKAKGGKPGNSSLVLSKYKIEL